MRIDQRAFIYIGANIDVHGRHANHRWRDVGALADSRASGHNANTIGRAKIARRKGVFINKSESAAAGLSQLAQPKAEQNALLHPWVDPPAAIAFIRGADLSRGKSVTELLK